MIRPQPTPPLFPYTTLFRSDRPAGADHAEQLLGRPPWARRHHRAEHRAGAVEAAILEGQVLGIGLDPLDGVARSEEHTSELQSRLHLVCRLLLEKKKRRITT